MQETGTHPSTEKQFVLSFPIFRSFSNAPALGRNTTAREWQLFGGDFLDTSGAVISSTLALLSSGDSGNDGSGDAEVLRLTRRRCQRTLDALQAAFRLTIAGLAGGGAGDESGAARKRDWFVAERPALAWEMLVALVFERGRFGARFRVSVGAGRGSLVHTCVSSPFFMLLLCPCLILSVDKTTFDKRMSPESCFPSNGYDDALIDQIRALANRSCRRTAGPPQP